MEITKIQGIAAVEARPPARPERRRPPGRQPAEDQAAGPGDPAGRKENQAGSPVRVAASELGQRLGLQVELSHDEATGREVVRIFSEDGKRLLRQLPPEQVLRMAAQARDGALEGVLSSLV
jgi:hypothetical protein